MTTKIIDFMKAKLSKKNKPLKIDERILSIGKNCIKLIESNKPTNSFLGGRPIVSSYIEWPRKNGKPLSFIAQLDLSEINKDKLLDWLPQKGRLLFFYDIEEQPWGFDPNDGSSNSVIYEKGSNELYELVLPIDLKSEQMLSSIKYLNAEAFISLPDSTLLRQEDIELIVCGTEKMSDFDEDIYMDFVFDNIEEYPHHQIGGFPTAIQDANMEEECLLVSHGINCGGSDGYYSDEAKELMNEVNDWKLLLQFESDDDVGAMWGDLGSLYFWVPESNAKRNDFSNSWVILQCS